MSKINVWPIVVDHWRTLRDYGSNAPSMRDVAWFAGAPLVACVALLYLRLQLSSDAVSVLITALSIFAGLLLNLLLLTHNIIAGSAAASTSRRRLLLKEIYRNISYAILLSLVTVAVLIAAVLLPGTGSRWIASAAVYALVTHFLLTLLMILKRVHVMLAKEYDQESSSHDRELRITER